MFQIRTTWGHVDWLAVCFFAALPVLLHSTACGDTNRATGMNLPESPSPSAIVKTYDDMETALIMSLQEQRQTNSLAITKMIQALGHIRSTNSVSLLLEMLEYNPRGEVTLMGIKIGASGGPGYVAVGALAEIGVPLDRCMEEIEKASAGSRRERLLSKLAYKCHGKAFADRVRDRLSNSGNEKMKWEQVLNLLSED